MRWVGHVAYMEEIRNAWMENMNRRDHSEDLGIDERILLKWILRK
jgi:hypothetical protein